MSAQEVGAGIVSMCREGKFLEAVEEYYADDVVSIEAADMGDMPARMEGIEAIKGKGSWWVENHEVHSMKIDGPFVDNDPNQFAVRFEMDLTNKPSGERMQMSEVGLYTVRDGKITEERFLYLTD